MLSLGQDLTQCTDEKDDLELMEETTCAPQDPRESLTLALWSQTAVEFCSATNCASHLLQILSFFLPVFFNCSFYC